MIPREISAGRPHPLGSRWDGDGVNFAVFSANAERLELNLFDGDTYQSLDLPGRTGDVWHGYVPGLRPGCRYGYRAHGAYDPARGLRFNPHKLLIDPYARWLDGAFAWDASLHAHVMTASPDDRSFSELDSAAHIPKCVVIDESALQRTITRPATAWRDTVIYEVHLKGLTKRCAKLPADTRGTFAALAAPATINYLRELGVTAVELLPVHAFANEAFLLQRNLTNYWGYNSVGFFAPHSKYLSKPNLTELTQTIDTLHAAGLEVILDVVFNHTGEGDEFGPTYNFRGLDNTTYYRLQHDAPRHYVNDAGCGNALAIYRPPVRQLVIDSLVYWHNVIGVDGFRFDLAVSLGRDEAGFSSTSDVLSSIATHPQLAGAKLIAEPWDVGPEGYRLGGFPAPYAEWNDRFRDSVRRFWRGDAGLLPELATRIHGSSDLFGQPQRGPAASINFVTSHDGFTAVDVTTYSERYNQANGEDNRDGHSENFSDNCGHEGPTSEVVVRARRLQRQRNLIATMLLSQGTPMLLAGDELGHTQKGNNNAYCQDNETTWLDWRKLGGDDSLHAFVAQLLTIRREHPVLRREHFAHGGPIEAEHGLADLMWLTSDGEVMQEVHWHDPGRRTLAMLLVPTVAELQSGVHNAVVVAINGTDTGTGFHIAHYAPAYDFECLLNTGGEPLQLSEGTAWVDAQTLCMFTGSLTA